MFTPGDAKYYAYSLSNAMLLGAPIDHDVSIKTKRPYPRYNEHIILADFIIINIKQSTKRVDKNG